MTIIINAKEYPANYTDNVFGDYCALVQLAIRAPHPAYPEKTMDAQQWMLISSAGKPPKIFNAEEAIAARANTFCSNTGYCHVIANSH